MNQPESFRKSNNAAAGTNQSDLTSAWIPLRKLALNGFRNAGALSNTRRTKKCTIIHYSFEANFCPDCNCAAVIGSANRNPPRARRAQACQTPPLHGEAHAITALAVPACSACGLRAKLSWGGAKRRVCRIFVFATPPTRKPHFCMKM